MRRRRLLAAGLLLAAGTVSARFADFPLLPVFISVEIARVDPTLGPRLAALQKERADLMSKADDFDRDCARVAAGSAADTQCAKYFPILSTASTRHGEKSEIFLQAYAAASRAAMVIAPPILRTGELPKAVDDAIVRAYSAAVPAITDRVRRGFQAVQARDWKLAVAWFKDALSRDPGNVGLRHLVELAEAPAQPAAPKPQLPDDGDVQFLFPGELPLKLPALRTPDPDEVYYYRPTQGYNRMTLDGARLQQLLDTISGKPVGSIVRIR